VHKVTKENEDEMKTLDKTWNKKRHEQI